MITTAKRLFPTNLMFLKIPIWSSQLAQVDKASSFVIGSFGHQGYGLKLKGGLESKDTHYFGLDSHIFRSCSSTIDSLQFGDKKKNFTIQSLFTCHYSLSLFIRYCSWHCSLRNFAYLRGVVPYVQKKFYFKSSFLERVLSCETIFERIHFFLTSLQSL